jgi:hypothetical protein
MAQQGAWDRAPCGALKSCVYAGAAPCVWLGRGALTWATCSHADLVTNNVSMMKATVRTALANYAQNAVFLRTSTRSQNGWRVLATALLHLAGRKFEVRGCALLRKQKTTHNL